jgi:subtilisin family serine protease
MPRISLRKRTVAICGPGSIIATLLLFCLGYGAPPEPPKHPSRKLGGAESSHLSADHTLFGPFAEQENPGSPVPIDRKLARPRVLHEIERLGVDRWHDAGYRGRGVKVAVLDSGFRGYHAFLGKELPSKIAARAFRSDGDLEARNSQHGIICAEVIHRLAPDAEIIFASWDPERPDEFLDAVRWARRMGAKVLSCSLIMPSWSNGEGGGEIHAALSSILGKESEHESALCFASAGNIAQRHWCGIYREGPDGFHEWENGRSTNVLTPWGTDHVSAELYWSNDADYELTVLDHVSLNVIGRSAPLRGVDRCAAVVGFDPSPGHTYSVRVRRLAGAAGRFHLASLCSNLGYSKSTGSIAFPADGPEVIAVGAVDDEGRREDYSSCGPNSMQPKPDLVAPVPFVTALRSRPFSGTSAAAPQAAALAALWWSRHPDWSAARVHTSILGSAHDLGPRGHDWQTGYGRIQLPWDEK